MVALLKKLSLEELTEQVRLLFILMDLFSINTGDVEFRVRGDGEVGADGSVSGGGKRLCRIL